MNLDVTDNNTRVKLWIKYELAARKIQRNYRRYYTTRSNGLEAQRLKIKLKSLQRLNRAFDLPYLMSGGHGKDAAKLNTSAPSNSKATTSIAGALQAIIEHSDNKEDKFFLWRTIIDLRRNNPTLSVDLLIKALMEAHGDLSRASLIMSNREFLAQNKTPMPNSIKNLLLPSIGPLNSENAVLPLFSDPPLQKNVAFASTQNNSSMPTGKSFGYPFLCSQL